MKKKRTSQLFFALTIGAVFSLVLLPLSSLAEEPTLYFGPTNWQNNPPDMTYSNAGNVNIIVNSTNADNVTYYFLRHNDVSAKVTMGDDDHW